MCKNFIQDKQVDRINKASKTVLATFETMGEAIPKRSAEIYTSTFGLR